MRQLRKTKWKEPKVFAYMRDVMDFDSNSQIYEDPCYFHINQRHFFLKFPGASLQ